MRVCLAYGRHLGEVIDLPPDAARAMLADGRASVVEDASYPDVILPAAASTDHTHRATPRVASREDRGMPRGKRRAVR
jgi:hypothetical protein